MSRDHSHDPNPPGDAELIRRVREEDAETASRALEELHRRYDSLRVRVRVRDMMRGCVGVGEDDISNEVWVKAWQALKKPGGYDDRQQFGAWLGTIAHRTALSALRRNRPEVSDEAPDRRPAPVPRPDLVILLRECMAPLRPEVRALMIARMHGYSYEELAQKFNMKVGTVAATISRTRTTLESCVQSKDGF